MEQQGHHPGVRPVGERERRRAVEALDLLFRPAWITMLARDLARSARLLAASAVPEESEPNARGGPASGSRQTSSSRWLLGSQYAVAVGATAIAFAATFALKRTLPTPSFLFFVPAVAVSVWYGGGGPGVVATMLSLLCIKLAFLPPVGSLRISRLDDLLEIVAFLVVALTITGTMEALRRARGVAESHAAALERLNEQLKQVAARATKLLDVTAALSQAPTLEDVTGVVLGKGVALVEASRAILVCTEGDRVEVLGSRGFSPRVESRIRADGRNAKVAVMEAIRIGAPLWIESSDEYRARFPRSFAEAAPLAEDEALCAMPLIHADEIVGGLAMAFVLPRAFGVTDRTFTLLLAQATAAALHRAWSYDAERQKRHDAELLARAREEVLGVVAHDLRNPLNVISVTTQFLLEEELPAERRKSLLDVATRSVKLMNALIGDLLDTVRLQAGRLSLGVEDVSVDAIVRQAEETFRPVADERRIHLEMVAPVPNAAVRADPLRVSQIVGNLMGNALKFTPDEGRVTLHAARDGEKVVFHVVDTGPGIPPSQIEHLFDKFWQARQNDHRGAGLGLAIAKGFVEAQGGNLWVESTVGAGSTFSFTLPAATETLAGAAVSISAA